MNRSRTAWEKEYRRLWKEERRFLEKNRSEKKTYIDKSLETVVPQSVKNAIESAFEKAFSLVFEKGGSLIQSSGSRHRKAYLVRCYAAQMEPGRKALRTFSKAAAGTGRKNLLLSGVEGIGLGLAGVGLPDVPLFAGMVLRSVFEQAAVYGYPWKEASERRLALELIAAALSSGEELEAANRAINHFLQEGTWETDEREEESCRRAGEALSRSMLTMKFLQGIPVAGAVGGAWDAVILRRVQRYAELKYRRRFLIDWKKERKEG